ncbi:MAG TPA: MBL fold metallo-hydrolase [Terriglobia bacterium]|nr:MBL fold metallo-hydrolase [Terriglobia bacterium]
MVGPAWSIEVLLTGSWRGATSVLLSNGHLHAVVDTGLPHEAHQLLEALRKKGLAPCDIAMIVNTHFHVDHVLNNCLFPSSTIYAPQESYEWCIALYSDMVNEVGWVKRILKYYPETFDYEHAEANMGKLRKFTLRWWDVGRLGSPSQFRWAETHSLPEGLEPLVTQGHVPGHVSLIVPTHGVRTVIAGDALLTRDHDEQVLTMIPQSRKQSLLDRDLVLASGQRIIPGHDREFLLSGSSAIEPAPRE